MCQDEIWKYCQNTDRVQVHKISRVSLLPQHSPGVDQLKCWLIMQGVKAAGHHQTGA